MTSEEAPGASNPTSWAERVAERSPSVQQSRERSVQRATEIVAAARRLIAVKGAGFTTHELVKEAGIAVQTFYKHFASKDLVLLAVIEDMIAETCSALELQGRAVTDPVERLRGYVVGMIDMAEPAGFASPIAQFVTTQHWRLQQEHPAELALAMRPVVDLLLAALQEAGREGLLAPLDPEYDAWLVAQLITAVFHHYSFSPTQTPVEEVAERMWRFCFAAWGGLPAGQARRPLRRRVG